VLLSVKLTEIQIDRKENENHIEIKENEKKTHKYTHNHKEIEKIVRSGKNKKKQTKL